MQFGTLSDEELLNGMIEACGSSLRFTACIVGRLVEVEHRRLHVEMGYSSMLAFCEKYLRMGKGEACRRLTAARVVRDYPFVLEMIENGDLRLEGIGLLARYLGFPGGQELLTLAAGRTTAEIEALIAERFPQLDLGHRLERAQRPHLAPTARDRYKLTLTLTEEQKDDLLKARDLMSHLGADFATVVNAGIKALLKGLEKKATRSVNARPSKNPSYVPRAARREKLEHAEQGCEFVSADGNRCGSRERLQVDHRQPKALGGRGDSSNLRLLCQRHNLHEARRVLGADCVERHIPSKTARDVQSALTNLGFAARDVRQGLRDLGETQSERAFEDLFRLVIGHLTP